MVTVNKEQKLYIIPSGKYFSCLGFDQVVQRSSKLAEWLKTKGIDVPVPKRRGTMKAYNQYSNMLKIAADYCHKNNTKCEIDLVPQLVGLEGKRVEITDSYSDTRRFKVGKSTGWLPCHLEIARSNSLGGFQVFGHPFKKIKVLY
jgi:hypothetical protein